MGLGTGIGIYVHIPFCDGKCPYCDFYSITAPDASRGESGEKLRSAYRDAAIREIDIFAARKEDPEDRIHVDTVYFGGGTPLLLGADRLCGIYSAIGRMFDIMSGCEVTVEVNPRSTSLHDLLILKRAGFSRLSIGAQSGVDAELAALGRRHNTRDIIQVFREARSVGFENISLDMMLAVPGQDKTSLAHTVELYSELSPEHISAYILRVEPDTVFGRMGSTLNIPDDDGQAELYLEACGLLEKAGYKQYEISNFCRPGCESRHNLKYWRCEEYIGIGAAAHGFTGGRRYYHPRDIEAYIHSSPTEDDGEGGTKEEYIMLALRLAEGLTEDGYKKRFGESLPEEIRKKASMLEKAGLLISDADGIRLTRSGFLVSNAVIAELAL